jgi:putative membrane protein
MWFDSLLAYFHHLAVFGLFAMVMVEWIGLRPGLSAADLRRLGRVDAAYGALAGLVLIAGFARIYFGAKGADFYLDNPVFQLKLGLFLAMGLTSIVPTVRLLRWRKALAADANALPTTAQINSTRKLIGLQLLLWLGIPLAAALMARGVGY